MAGYVKPGVLIVQEIRSASPPIILPDQKACIVGPAYQIVRNAFAGHFEKEKKEVFELPGLIRGATVDTNSINVILKNAEIPFTTIANVSLRAGDDYYENLDLDFVSLGIKEGYIFTAGDFKTVIKKVEPRRIYFTDSVLNDINADAVISRFDTVEAVAEYDANTGTIRVISNALSGYVYVSYKALRSDIANKLLTFANLKEVEEQLGEISLENPLTYAVAKALANTTVAVFAMPIRTNDANGYAEAFNHLAAEDVYFVVPLTDDPAVIGMLPGYLESLSKPEVKRWRVAIVSPRFKEEEVVAEGTGDLTSGVLYDPNAKFTSVYDPRFSFYVKIDDAYYKVDSVITNQKLQLVRPYPQDRQNVRYQLVLKAETKRDKLRLIKDAVTLIKNRRIVAVFPNTLIDDKDQEVPGYYAAAAIAGLLSGLPAHKPITFMGIGGFKRTPLTDLSYFTDEELNEIAEAGYLILTQDSRNSLIYVRHQITTDNTSDFTRELSAVRTLDYLSVVFENAVKPFIGRFNLTDEIIPMIEDTIKMTAKILMSVSSPFIGPPLLDYRLGKVEKLTETTLAVELEVKIPMPLNYVVLRVVV